MRLAYLPLRLASSEVFIRHGVHGAFGMDIRVRVTVLLPPLLDILTAKILCTLESRIR